MNLNTKKKTNLSSFFDKPIFFIQSLRLVVYFILHLSNMAVSVARREGQTFEQDFDGEGVHADDLLFHQEGMMQSFVDEDDDYFIDDCTMDEEFLSGSEWTTTVDIDIKENISSLFFAFLRYILYG